MMQNSRGVVLSGTKTYFEGLKRVCVSYECFQQYLWHHNVHIQTLQLSYMPCGHLYVSSWSFV